MRACQVLVLKNETGGGRVSIKLNPQPNVTFRYLPLVVTHRAYIYRVLVYAFLRRKLVWHLYIIS
jgi:hypothetical protein